MRNCRLRYGMLLLVVFSSCKWCLRGIGLSDTYFGNNLFSSWKLGAGGVRLWLVCFQGINDDWKVQSSMYRSFSLDAVSHLMRFFLFSLS